MTIPKLPRAFRQRIKGTFGDEGQVWLRELPALITACTRQWSLQVGPPFVPLSYNYVAPATTARGDAVVLKIGVPNPELYTEIAALRHYAGRGCVRLLQVDASRGAMLLERLQPGTELVTVGDDQATIVAAAVMRRLWRPVPDAHPFPTVADWMRGLKRLRAAFGGSSGPFPESLVARAEALAVSLLASSAPPVLLHGDLHHYNILAAQREPWLALDPKGLVGEPAYEVGALLRNPAPQITGWENLERLLGRRVARLHETLGFAAERMVGWGIVQAVLSSWWSYEENAPDWQRTLIIAEALAKL